jgi:hypothetical protein
VKAEFFSFFVRFSVENYFVIGGVFLVGECFVKRSLHQDFFAKKKRQKYPSATCHPAFSITAKRIQTFSPSLLPSAHDERKNSRAGELQIHDCLGQTTVSDDFFLIKP